MSVLLPCPLLCLVKTSVAHLSFGRFDGLEMMCIYRGLIGSLFRCFVGFVILFGLDLGCNWCLYELVVESCFKLVHVL